MPTKPIEKNAACCSSGKFIAWIGFILATFALAGVIVVVADKTTCGDTSLAAKSAPVVAKTKIEQPTNGKSLVEIEELRSSLAKLDLENSLMREYLARATAGDPDLEWSSYFTRGYGFIVSFDYPSLPTDVERYETEGSKGIRMSYTGGAPFWNFSINISGDPMGSGCTKVVKGNIEYCRVDDMFAAGEGELYQFEALDSAGASSTVALSFSRCRPLPTDRTECLDQKLFDKAVDRVLARIRIERALFD